jgi:hypothetical protein
MYRYDTAPVKTTPPINAATQAPTISPTDAVLDSSAIGPQSALRLIRSEKEE